ncbi:hypothetical protein BJY01DRAFT_104151 [Aspergillus pseudoustus]|uniref:Uncharacterized protein n=1 Tax=Aspergillus pseudoustus TaxID=1810923 RepID=A0ABR4KI77_9EURO
MFGLSRHFLICLANGVGALGVCFARHWWLHGATFPREPGTGREIHQILALDYDPGVARVLSSLSLGDGAIPLPSPVGRSPSGPATLEVKAANQTGEKPLDMG